MADSVKLIDAQIKATQRLNELQNQLNQSTGAQAREIQTNIDKITQFISKVDKVKTDISEASSEFSDLASQITISNRASDTLGKGFTSISKQVKGLSKIQFDITDGGQGLEAANALSSAAVNIARSQQNMLAAADGTAEELAEATREYEYQVSFLKTIDETYGDVLQSNKQLGAWAKQYKDTLNLTNLELQKTIGLTEDELAAYKDLTAEADRMAARLKGIGAMITTTLKKPMVLLGLGITAVGQGISKWGESVRSFGGYVDSAQISSFALGAVFKDAEQVTKSLSKEFGGLKDVTFQTQLNTNLMATNMGISGDEAASVVGNFARMNEGSAATAMDMAATTKAMGKAAGVPIDSLMKDVAGSSKAFAEYGKDGGLNIAKAAVSAAKLGVGMDSLTKVTDSLLDFETSINAEMELGAMMGKQLNLDRARGLAATGDMTGAVKETLQQLGGIDEFNKMDIFQKRKAAELLGLSVDEYQKMAANADKLNDDGTVQLSTFDSMKETLTALATGPLGSMVKGLGTGVMMAGQMGGSFAQMGMDVKGMASKIPIIGKLFKGGGAAGAAPTAGATPGAATTPAGGGGADQANKFGKIKSSDLIKGAAALLILAAALYVSAKAFQQFATVKWEDVGKGLVGLVGLAGIAYILSKASGSMIQGAIAIAILGAALIPFAFAMSLIQGLSIDSVLAAAAGLVLFGAAAAGIGLVLPFILAGSLGIAALGASLIVFGTGMNLMGSGFAAISASLPGIIEQVSAVSQIDFMPILGLAGALTMLAGALALVAISGLLALPVLMALGGLSSLFGGGGEGGGGGEKTDSTAQLIEEIKGLRADLNAGKISVNMDGQKVTSKVSAIVDKGSSNSYAKR
jgi:hypothetical protein